MHQPVLVLSCLMAAIATGDVWAAEFCVSNDSELIVAVATAEITPTVIKLVQGTYHVEVTAFNGTPQRTFQGFSLLGGYTANCAARQIDPTNTVITNITAGATLFGYVMGDVTVEGIRFTGSEEAGLFLTWDESFNSVNDSVKITVRRNIFAGNSGGVYLEWRVGNSHSLRARLVNNLAHDLLVAGGACAFTFDADPDVDANFYLINNTVVDSNAPDDIYAGAVCVIDGGVLFAYNNIFYGTTAPGSDLYSYNNQLFLVDNVIGSRFSPAPFTPPVGTQTGDPKLAANFHPIEAPLSPVINTGTLSVPGGLPGNDLDGGPRVVGSTVDRGAFESSIDDSFIQTVTNVNNAGDGSLRAAINNVNANGGGLVKFAIDNNCGPKVISLTSVLPAITAPVIINGYTQTGSSPNDLDIGDDAVQCIVLESGAAGVDSGLRVLSGAGDGTSVLLKGLAFSGFNAAAIDFDGGSNHEIAGNHFGGSVSGYALLPNHFDIRFGLAEHDSLIGGDDVGARNIIGDAKVVGEEAGVGILLLGGASGPLLLGSNDNQIVANLIGLGWSINSGAYTNRGNSGAGVQLLGHDNTVRDNVIGDNGDAGVLLDGAGAVGDVVDGNLIGVTNSGADVGNGLGINVRNDAHDNNVRLNTISNNAKGVVVSTGNHNKIRRNSIFGNTNLGIDLAAPGVTPNDDDGAIQPLGYANRGQNFPVLTFALGGDHQGTVGGTLTSTAGDYTLDFYASFGCDASGNGEGRTWLRSFNFTLPAPQVGDQSTKAFEVPFNEPDITLGGTVITATATDSVGDTSEFSACQSYDNNGLFSDSFETPPA